MELWRELKGCMERYPTSTVTEDNTVYTYAELICKVEELASKLDGTCYAIYCCSELNAAIAILACFAAKKTAIPLSYRYGDIHSKRILDLICPPYIITDIYDEGGVRECHVKESGYHEQYISDPDCRPAVIMCTSGTTGTPKGAKLTDSNILCNLRDIQAYFSIHPDDCVFLSRPLYHCAVLTGEFLISLMTGCSIVFYSESFNPSVMFHIVCEKHVTVWGNTPTLWKSICLLAHSMKIPLHLKTIMVSGESLPSQTAELMRRTFPKTNIYHVYGLTEASPRVAFLPPSEFDFAHRAVGYPLKSLSYRIVDENDNFVKDGEVGELIIKGESIMCGYYNNREETNRVLKDGWLHTGDMVSVDNAGQIVIHGRKDKMIIRAGMNIYPAEIETALSSDPRVKDLYVFGKPDAMYGESIVLVISGNFESEREIRTLCMRTLPSYEQPTVIKWLDELTYTASGKIVRSEEV